jgi:hypothetical protein
MFGQLASLHISVVLSCHACRAVLCCAVLQVLLGLRALLCEPLLQALLCAHQGLTGLSGDVSSLVEHCRRELRDREAAGGQHALLESHQDTGGSSSASGMTDSEAGTEVGTAAADDMQVDAESPLRSCSGRCDSDAVCGADADTVMEDAAEVADEQAAAGGTWQGAGDGCTHAVAAGQSGGGSAGIDQGSEEDANAVAAGQSGDGCADADEGSAGFGEDSDSLGDFEFSEDDQQDLQDDVMSATPAAAASGPTAAGEAARLYFTPRTNYTEEEQAVMRELNISSLMHITPCSQQKGGGWCVRLRAAARQAYGERYLMHDSGLWNAAAGFMGHAFNTSSAAKISADTHTHDEVSLCRPRFTNIQLCIPSVPTGPSCVPSVAPTSALHA